MNETRWQSTKVEYEEPPQEFIDRELQKYDEIVTQFCRISDIDKTRVEVNIQALKDVIIRVDMRKLYFQIYHSNMEANEYKVITGLECFWVLKLRPFWMKILPEDSKEVMQMATWINEKIALHMTCSLLKEYNPDFFEKGQDICELYCKELEYSFRYRDLSKESMFLMFDPFYFTHLCNASISEENLYIL
ncbi:MAG: hypothetical protein HFE76_11795 [Firmicutes bacterium]|nr:hypothetical protein [Bacillota bacterium]